MTEGYFPRADFAASPTVYRYVMSDAFVRGIMGPRGGGKSYGSCIAIMRHACQQAPNEHGIRRTRWAVIRNTYQELRDTTIKTWLEAFPEAHCGPLRRTLPMVHHIKRAATPRAPGLDMEVIFLALDREDDQRKLKSFELTGAWVNECIEVPKGIVDMLTASVGRFPARSEAPITWRGVLLDTNACDEDNWYYRAAEQGDTSDLARSSEDYRWEFYRQPPAILEVKHLRDELWRMEEAGYGQGELPPDMRPFFAATRYWMVNPDAENLDHLQPGYYQQQVQNKTLPWLQRFLQAKYIYFVDGRPWVPEYVPHLMGIEGIPVSPALPLHGGIDAGGGALNPAAVIGQLGPYGDWRMLLEVSMFDMGIERFSETLKRRVAEAFPGLKAPRYVIDPAGEQRDQIYETSVLEHLRSRGVEVMPAPTNAIETRREAMALPMGRLININGDVKPGFLVDRRRCPMLHAALAGKWYRRRLKTRDDRWEEKPTKNEYSHVADACSYLLLGGGEHDRLTRRPRRGEPAPFGPGQMSVDFPVFGHG